MPIRFGEAVTRAGLDDIKNGGFGVWAFFSNTEVQNYPLMTNRHVTFEDGDWFYSPTEYWLNDTKYSFIALYPYAEEPTNVEVDENSGVMKLSVAETPSETDWLIATNNTDTSESYDPTVSLQFQHALTNVGFKIWRDGGVHQNDKIRVNKVTLSNVRKVGTASISSASTTWEYTNDRLTVEVDNSANLTNDTNIGAVTVDPDSGEINTHGNTAYDPFGQMMLLPQTISAGVVTLNIEYELQLNNADKDSWTPKEAEKEIPAITWESGRKYIYNVVLSDATYITIIQTTVDEWGTPQVGGTVIIK